VSGAPAEIKGSPEGHSYVKKTSENQRCFGDLPIKIKKEKLPALPAFAAP